MPREPALVDTNVLVYALDPTSPHHRVCRDLLKGALEPDARLCVTPQILAEFYAVETSPARIHTPQEPQETIDTIELILEYPGVTLLPAATPGVVNRWVELLRRHPVRGQKVFDLQLVAVMLDNGVSRIYTFNARDFAVFEEIEVLTP